MSSVTTERSTASPWNVPNVLTVVRLLLVPVFGWLLLAHPDDAAWRWAATGVFVLAMLTDLADGHLARKHDIVTDFGRLVDPIADKAITGMAFVGLSIIGDLWWWVTITILVREWGITLLRFVLTRDGIVMAANRGGKLKTVLQTAALVLFLLPLPAWGTPFHPLMLLDGLAAVIMAAAWLATMITGLDYCREAWRARRQARTV